MRLEAKDLQVYLGDRRVLEAISLSLERGDWLAIVGPNGAGKSTLLRVLARLLRPRRGVVLLDNHEIHRLPTKTVARRLAILVNPLDSAHDTTVEELVWRGRYPHQKLLAGATRHDREMVEWAISTCQLQDLRGRPLSHLSAGERQRAWLAMALAQEPEALFLDEPTSFLDYRHQVEVMDLLGGLNRQGLIIVMATHDLNVAARYARTVLALKDGRILAMGPLDQVLTPEVLRELYQVEFSIVGDSLSGRPVCIPLSPLSPDLESKDGHNHRRVE